MALPTLVHSYQFRLGQRFLITTTETIHSKERLLHLKDTMTGYYAPDAGGSWSSPWVVRGSSNGTSYTACPADTSEAVAAGTTGARNANDKWTAYTDINHAGPASARSWIVMRQTGIASKFEICIDCSQSNTGYNNRMISMYISYNAGFTGGTTTARPTATDEYWFMRGGAETNGTISSGATGGNWEGELNGNNYIGVHNIIQSTDGAITIFIKNYNTSYVPAMWIIAKPVNVHPLWTNPSMIFSGRGANSNTWAIDNAVYAYSYDAPYATSKVNSVDAALYMTTEIARSATIGRIMTVPGTLDSTYPMTPIGLYSATAGVKARVGTLEDIYFGSTTPAAGDTYPNDTSRLWCQFGDFIVPWDGSVPVVA